MLSIHNLVKREAYLGGGSGKAYVEKCQRWPLTGPWSPPWPDLMDETPDLVWYEAGDIRYLDEHQHFKTFADAASSVCSMQGDDVVTQSASPDQVRWFTQSMNLSPFPMQLTNPADIEHAEKLTAR